MQIRRDGNGIPLPLPQQPIYNMKIDGFLPVIINITPVINMTPLLLGDLVDDDGDFDLSLNRSFDPMRRIDYFTIEDYDEAEALV